MKTLGTLLFAGNLLIATSPLSAVAQDVSTKIYTIITDGRTSFIGEGEFSDETGGASQECKIYEVKGKKLVINIITRPSLLDEGDDELGDMLPDDENTEIFDIPANILEDIRKSPNCSKDQQRIPLQVGHTPTS